MHSLYNSEVQLIVLDNYDINRHRCMFEILLLTNISYIRVTHLETVFTSKSSFDHFFKNFFQTKFLWISDLFYCHLLKPSGFFTHCTIVK